MNFGQLRNFGIKEEVLTGLNGLGFIEQTPVQEQVIPLILDGQDVLAQAPTGTGKTAAFGVPIISMADINSKDVETIILTPTRELAMQICQDLKKIASCIEGLKIVPIYGGQNLDRQLAFLRKKSNIIVGTTGRIVDHLRRKTLKLTSLKRIVLDEVDEMLDMGFREDIDYIFDKVEGHIQTAMFSATIPEEIFNLSKKYQQNVVFVKTTINGQDIPNIKQYVVKVSEEKKYSSLKEILWKKGYKNVLIFCNTKARVETLNQNLNRDHISAMCIHGDMHQKDRDKVMKLYKAHDINTLVATDVASRGIDVEGIDAIFNYDVPFEADSYVHRIGRTARANKDGVAYTFCAPKDKGLFNTCEKAANIKMLEYNIDGVTQNGVNKQKYAVPTIRFFLNVGTKDGANKEALENMITAKCHIKQNAIYDYTIHDIYSFIEVDAKYRDLLLALNGIKAFQRKLGIEVCMPKKSKKNTNNFKKSLPKVKTYGRIDKKDKKNVNKLSKEQEKNKKSKSRFHYGK